MSVGLFRVHVGLCTFASCMQGDFLIERSAWTGQMAGSALRKLPYHRWLCQAMHSSTVLAACAAHLPDSHLPDSVRRSLNNPGS